MVEGVYGYEKRRFYKNVHEITSTMGDPIIKDSYYSDHYIGYEYVFKSLKLINYNYDKVSIYVDDFILYNSSTNSKKIIEGKWINLIN